MVAYEVAFACFDGALNDAAQAAGYVGRYKTLERLNALSALKTRRNTRCHTLTSPGY